MNPGSTAHWKTEWEKLHSWLEHRIRRTSQTTGTADERTAQLRTQDEMNFTPQRNRDEKTLQSSLKQRVEDHHRMLQHKMERTSQINWKRLGKTSQPTATQSSKNFTAHWNTEWDKLQRSTEYRMGRTSELTASRDWKKFHSIFYTIIHNYR
jgi:hypothetical protein